jgi:hypothetical protein
MAKIEKASEDVAKLFSEVRDKTTIPQWVEIEVLANNKQKELYKIVKLNDIVEILTQGLNFAVVLNEEILEQLTAEQQEMAINECLAGVNVNENDVVSLGKPNFSTYRGVLEKYGHDPIIVLHESVKSLYDVKKQKEEEEKATKKGKKSNLKKTF